MLKKKVHFNQQVHFPAFIINKVLVNTGVQSQDNKSLVYATRSTSSTSSDDIYTLGPNNPP